MLRLTKPVVIQFTSLGPMTFGCVRSVGPKLFLRMKIDSRNLANWLVSGAVMLGSLFVARSIVVPFLFAVLLWSVLNALTDQLQRLRTPRWLAWIGSLATVSFALYVLAQVLANEASALANQGPAYIARLGTLFSHWLAFLHMELAINQADLVSRNDLAAFLKDMAASAGDFIFQLILIAVFVGFLLAEQRNFPAKLASLTIDGARRDASKEVIQKIARQVQSYLGVCTFLSSIMAALTYTLLTLLGVEFAGFWALVMFILTYVPTIGAVGVLLPASMALLQLGSFEMFLLVAIALGVTHFVLANIVQAVLLGRSLDLSPLAIILSLSFWGLLWGIAGLFLAVPITAALAIVCQHIDGAQWIAVGLAGNPKRRRS